MLLWTTLFNASICCQYKATALGRPALVNYASKIWPCLVGRLQQPNNTEWPELGDNWVVSPSMNQRSRSLAMSLMWIVPLQRCARLKGEIHACSPFITTGYGTPSAPGRMWACPSTPSPGVRLRGVILNLIGAPAKRDVQQKVRL